jgi:pimeloyl-ACP methyl ester carboxylesterase
MIKNSLIPSFLLVISLQASDTTSPLLTIQEVINQKCKVVPISDEFVVNHESPFFDTRYLANPVEVERELLSRGFESVRFTTDDGIDLHGLFRKVEHPRYSVVLSAGFFPGRMTGLATFVELLNQAEVNILFYDARGKGKSGGFSEFLKLWRYGVDDYKDVEAAVLFSHMQDRDLPIYVYGCCAGAFHSARALIEMSKKSAPSDAAANALDKVNGLIFDSGWSSVPETSISALTSFFDQSPFYIRYPAKGILYPALTLFNLFYNWRYDHTSSLYKIIGQLPCPLLVVHSRNDAFARYEKVLHFLVRLFSSTGPGKQAQVFLWVLEKSKHAVHHLKHKQLYANVLLHFIRYTMEQKVKGSQEPVSLITYQQQVGNRSSHDRSNQAFGS